MIQRKGKSTILVKLDENTRNVRRRLFLEDELKRHRERREEIESTLFESRERYQRAQDEILGKRNELEREADVIRQYLGTYRIAQQSNICTAWEDYQDFLALVTSMKEDMQLLDEHASTSYLALVNDLIEKHMEIKKTFEDQRELMQDTLKNEIKFVEEHFDFNFHADIDFTFDL